MKNLSVNEIEKMLENNELSGELLAVLNIFLSSINDWPTPIPTLYEYATEIEVFIKSTSTKKNIEESLKQINFSKNSWQAESLVQIIDVFQFYKNECTLKEIIDDIKNKI